MRLERSSYERKERLQYLWFMLKLQSIGNMPLELNDTTIHRGALEHWNILRTAVKSGEEIAAKQSAL